MRVDLYGGDTRPTIAQVIHAQIRDVDIRRCLHAEMRRRHEAEADITLILDELGLCQGVARVDLAVVNGSLHGTKSRASATLCSDSQGQCDVYSRALDYVTIVTSAKHAKKVCGSVPSWWGIWAANPSPDGIELSEVSTACPNPHVDARAAAELLWRDEALEELESRALAHGLRGRPRRELWAKLAESMPLAELCTLVRERLKRRLGWRVVARPM
jgi:hypothetical protein